MYSSLAGWLPVSSLLEGKAEQSGGLAQQPPASSTLASVPVRAGRGRHLAGKGKKPERPTKRTERRGASFRAHADAAPPRAGGLARASAGRGRSPSCRWLLVALPHRAQTYVAGAKGATGTASATIGTLLEQDAANYWHLYEILHRKS